MNKGVLILTFQEENDALLKYLIDNLFINVFDVTEEKARATSNRLEIFITPTCNQVCEYCLTGDAKIRMSDLSEKNIKDVKIGDKILAFDEYPPEDNRSNSSTCIAEVTQVFHRKSKVLEMTFDDGTVLHITENHPLLVRRNRWEDGKYDFREAGQVKVGRKVYGIPKSLYKVYEDADIHDDDYIIGYLVGMILGDGTLKDYRAKGSHVFFRLAVKDEEILDRVGEYLKYLKIDFGTYRFQVSKKEDKWIDAICSTKISTYENLRQLIDGNFRNNKSVDYYKGFLAGIYDAEGHIDKKSHTIRICNTDWKIIQEICDGMSVIGIEYIIEQDDKGTVNFDKKWNVRVVAGNNGNNYKFVKLISPATPRKGLLNFTKIKMNRKVLVSTRVAEELGEVDVYNFETTSHTYFANNIAVHNCYVMKHGNELYPFSLLNDAKMIDNLKKILTWLKLNNRTMEVFDLFSGEIWSDPLGYMVLDTLLEFYKNYRVSSNIVIPSNMSFLFAPNGEEKMQWYIDEFKKIGTRLVFSASIDGIYLEDKFRKFKHKKDTINIPRDQEYYEKIFKFCAKNRFLFHPMVAAKSCKYWVENFDWYMEMIKKHYGSYLNLMMLEVRDDDWEDEDIEYHHILLKHIIDFKLEKWFGGDINKFARYVAKIDDNAKKESNNIGLFMQGGRLTCAIQNTLCIRLADLAILPCHRTSYEQNIYGKLELNGAEMKVHAQNIELAIKVYSMNPNYSMPKCDTCDYKYLCMKGCLGSQYETNTDMFMPCKSVCKMEKAKIDFLIDTYEKMGVWDALRDEPKASRLLAVVDTMLSKRGVE